MQQKQTMKLRKQSSNNNKLASIAGNTQHTTDSKRRATNVASFNGSICQHAAIKTPNNTTTIQTELANSGIQRNWRTDRTMATHPQLLYLYVVVVVLVYMFEICLQQPATCHICWRFFILALEKITPCWKRSSSGYLRHTCTYTHILLHLLRWHSLRAKFKRVSSKLISKKLAKFIATPVHASLGCC